MRESKLQVALNIWGPIKINIDQRAHELWGKVSSEAVRKAFNTGRGGLARTRRVSARPSKDREQSGRSRRELNK